MFSDKNLILKVINENNFFKIVSLIQKIYLNRKNDFTLLSTFYWVNIVIFLKKDDKEYLARVIEYRFRNKKISFEFPGGFIKKDENSKYAVTREFREETGYKLNNLKKISTFSSIASFMTNEFNIDYSDDIVYDYRDLKLDENEFLYMKFIEFSKLLEKNGFSNDRIMLSVYLTYLSFKQNNISRI